MLARLHASIVGLDPTIHLAIHFTIQRLLLEISENATKAHLAFINDTWDRGLRVAGYKNH
jgi:hypothetical protein